MEQETDNTPPLLMLDDKSLLDIFKLLELRDRVHLADTCVRLRNVARLNKCKNIYISVTTLDAFNSRNLVSKEEFVNIMSLIGEHVVNVYISHGFNDVFEIIKTHCKNVNFLQTCKCQEQIIIDGFHNLKELKLTSSWLIDVNVLPGVGNNILTLDVSSLNMDFEYEDDRTYFLKLLERLPKLKKLHLGQLYRFYNLHSREFLLRINEVNSFSFRSKNNYNHLLKKLLNLKLVELCFDMELNAVTFDIIQQFQNLEVLAMIQNTQMQEIEFPDSAVLPPKLKYVKIDNINIFWSKLVSIVEKAEYLEVIDLGSYGCIIFNYGYDRPQYFPNKDAGTRKNLDLISRIEKHLYRPLTIMYSHRTLDQQSNVYISKNLRVINNWFIDNQKPKETFERIFVQL